MKIVEQFNLKPGDDALIVTAHPDDLAIMHSGLALQLLLGGVNLHTVVATDGEISTLGDPDFVAGGFRRNEERESQNQIGIAEINQHYLGLVDGQVNDEYMSLWLVQGIADVIKSQKIKAVFSAGENGYNGHSDHATVYAGTVSALDLLQRDGSKPGELPVYWALNPHHTGEGVVPVNPYLKIAAAKPHVSQYGRKDLWYIRGSGLSKHSVLFEEFRRLFENETYDRVQPRTMSKVATRRVLQTV